MISPPLAQSFPPDYVGGSIFVDGAVGSDITGQRGRADLPFKTIEAANRASQWGDLIVIGYGVGYYSDPYNVACMAGRAYWVAPMVLLSSPLLNAPPIFFTDMVMGSTSTTVTSPTLNAFPSALLVDRELVILGGTTSGTDFVPARYKIMSVDAGVLTLNAPLASYSSGALGGDGYLSPGPMWTRAELNGQFDGMVQGQRFADAQINATAILLQTPGGSVVTTAGQYIEQANPEVFADGSTNWIPAGTDALGVGSPAPVTWTGPLASSLGGSARTASTTSNLAQDITTTAPTGCCTMIFTTRFGGSAPSGPEAANICGTGPGGTFVCYAEWFFSGGGVAIRPQVAGFPSMSGYTVSSYMSFNAYALMREQYDVTNSMKFYVGNDTTPQVQTNACNLEPASSQTSFLVGWDSAETLAGIEVGHFVLFDGAISKVKLFAWQNALLQDYGAY